MASWAQSAEFSKYFRSAMQPWAHTRNMCLWAHLDRQPLIKVHFSALNGLFPPEISRTHRKVLQLWDKFASQARLPFITWISDLMSEQGANEEADISLSWLQICYRQTLAIKNWTRGSSLDTTRGSSFNVTRGCSFNTTKGSSFYATRGPSCNTTRGSSFSKSSAAIIVRL